MRRSLYIALGVLIGAVLLSPPAWLRAQGYIPPMSIDLREEGSSVGRALALDCVGSAITCTFSATVGTLTITGGGAPTDAEYVVGAANGTLSAERVVTNTVVPAGPAAVAFDVATAGQLKATANAFPLLNNNGMFSMSLTTATNAFAHIGIGGPFTDGSGCVSSTVQADATNAKGIVYTCDTSGETTGTAVDPPHTWPSRRFHFQSYLKLDSTTNVRLFTGLHSNTTAASSPGGDDPVRHLAMFRYSTDAADTNYKCITNDNSGGGTINDSGVAATTTSHEFDIVGDGGSNIFFYIDGALVCTNTTNLPTAAIGRFYHLAITATATKVLSIYSFGVWEDR